MSTLVVCANVILDDRGGALLVREAKPEALGRWALPGGKLEADETLRQGAAREALEETGLTVEVGPLVGIFHVPRTLEGTSAVNFVFRSSIAGGTIAPTDDHPEARFIAPDDFAALEARHLMRGHHIALAVAAARAGRALPEDLVEVVPIGTRPALANDGAADDGAGTGNGGTVRVVDRP